MSTKPLVPTEKIPRNCNAAESVRLAYEEIQLMKSEIDSVAETLTDPFKASRHIIKALQLAHNAEVHLINTGIPGYRQEALYGKNS